jgi:ribonuclease D
MDIELHLNDLPSGLQLGGSIAIDTETMGLRPERDRLCLVQLATSSGECHLVQFPLGSDFQAPHLKRVLTDKKILKIFHFARFDLAALCYYLGVMTGPVYCTKIASKLARTYTDRHGLKDLCREILGVEISKQEQSSDWGAELLTPQQLAYAASDVLHLHKLKAKLDATLKREGRHQLAKQCFDFLPHRAHLDVLGWGQEDIFHH